MTKFAETTHPGPLLALDIARQSQSQLVVIGMVGAAGAGNSWSARVLVRRLAALGVKAAVVKARKVLAQAAGSAWQDAEALAKIDPIAAAQKYQDIGDGLRESNDHAFVAAGMIKSIAGQRTAKDAPTVFICDSMRNPAEINLLRMVYGDAYWTLGVVCDLEERRARLWAKFAGSGVAPGDQVLQNFIDRDQDDPERKHGQHVADAFALADYFVDCSDRLRDPDALDEEVAAWTATRELDRFLGLIRRTDVLARPTDAEQGMYHAYAARLGSACLSRQVGAALMDRTGQLLATGCNEVPRAGGGLYGQGDETDDLREGGRCHRLNGYCSNTRERNVIIENVLQELDLAGISVPDDKRDGAIKRLQRSRLGQLIEFSRSVHAEMDTLISAARKGVSTIGGRLFVTTFPCHNCARHIVAAGVDEVQFIEPYLKSQALRLHADAITQKRGDGELPPSLARARGIPGDHKVLFRPYVGAAPRLYRRAFVKDAEVKDPRSGDLSLADAAGGGLMTLRPIGGGFDALERRIAEQFDARGP
jgi:deoxycytidylate deaminase